MDAKQQALMKQISEYEFVCVELNEYLDTHPGDQLARDDYACYSRALQELIRAYEDAYAPLMNFGHSPGAAGCWVCSRWPWEM